MNVYLAGSLVALWCFGIIFFAMCFTVLVRNNEVLRLSLASQPWPLVMISLFCVAWPGMVLNVLLVATVSQIRAWKKSDELEDKNLSSW